jgi:hypothetical protein
METKKKKKKKTQVPEEKKYIKIQLKGVPIYRLSASIDTDISWNADVLVCGTITLKEKKKKVI